MQQSAGVHSDSRSLRRYLGLSLALLPIALLFSRGAVGQSQSAADWTAGLASEYAFTSGVTYLTAGGVELKLDVYVPRRLTRPNSVLLYFHGGGWMGGNRETAVLRLMPYLEMGFTVVNATYRGSRVALAPAAIEDCRCALYWVVANAEKYRFDLGKIVVTGDSAGSHLALMTGMLPASAGFDRPCATASQEPKVAAVVNWYGATDVGELVEGENARSFATAWFGSQPDRMALAKRVSPLTYVRPGVPAVLTVHAQSDSVVPVRQAERLHEELAKHGVVNQLVAHAEGGHGDFTRQQNESSYAAIRQFLGKLQLLPTGR